VKNLGSVHIHPQGFIIIKNILGKVVARIPANPANSAVLPNSIRRMETDWEKTPDQSGGFFTQLGDEWKNFALGRYTATVDATYGSTNAALTGPATSFWVFPWRLSLLSVILVIALIFLIRGYNGMVIKQAMRKKNIGKQSS
jgi:hypothetical protein